MHRVNSNAGGNLEADRLQCGRSFVVEALQVCVSWRVYGIVGSLAAPRFEISNLVIADQSG